MSNYSLLSRSLIKEQKRVARDYKNKTGGSIKIILKIQPNKNAELFRTESAQKLTYRVE